MQVSQIPGCIEDLQDLVRELDDRIRDLERDARRHRKRERDRASEDYGDRPTVTTRVHLRMFPLDYDEAWLKRIMSERFGPVRFVRVNQATSEDSHTWASVCFEDRESCKSCVADARELETRYGFKTEFHKDRGDKKRV